MAEKVNENIYKDMRNRIHKIYDSVEHYVCTHGNLNNGDMSTLSNLDKETMTLISEVDALEKEKEETYA